MIKKLQDTKSYTYVTVNKESMQIGIPLPLEDMKLQADKDYETSFTYIQKQEFFIWRQALKSYHLSTHDRKVALGSATWKQNISIGLIRSFVDVLIASVNEKPLTFIWTWINKKWIENKNSILKTLNYISDVSGFHKQLKKTLKSGLIIWEIAMRVGYMKTEKTEKITSIINWKYVEETEDVENKNYPYATNVNIFNIFPDPYSWPLRYTTERGVVSYSNFIETFGHMIRGVNNESPLWDNNFLSLLSINSNNSCFDNYGNILHQIHEKVNDELKEKDNFLENTKNKWTNWWATTQDQDKNVTEWLIEFKITYYKSRTVLIANWYPVYVWKNPYWFIPYVIQAANETEARFWEGIPYLLKGLEEVWNSFVCNYFDSARAIANPTIVVQKNLMINDEELEDWTPWGILYTENNDWWKAVYRLDKWGLQDFNILPIIEQIATRITWISEYNLGISSKERTAAWALSVTESSQKRMSPYLSNFLDAISIVAQMWLQLVKKFWQEEQFIYILDEDWWQTSEIIKNKDLAWQMNISLEAEWMFGAFNELELNKLINIYNTTSESGFVNSPEIVKEMFKKSGFEPSRFVTWAWEWIKPEWMDENPQLNSETWLEGDALSKILKEAGNVTQINQWNEGLWK